MNTEDPLVQQLRQLLYSLQASGQALLPGSGDALLKSIVEAAARIFNAGAASIALVNEQQQTLEFKVSVGAGNDIVGMSFPLDKGIAGYVAMTGQPLAVSNVQQDARFNQSFAQNTGYVPRSILAMPLISGERVIGVMEVLDKIDASSFGLQDMELLGMFARQAALAIDQSQHLNRMTEALIQGVKQLIASGEMTPADDLVALLENINLSQPGSQDLMALASAFSGISTLSEAEQRLCIKIIAAFTDFSSSKTRYHPG